MKNKHKVLEKPQLFSDLRMGYLEKKQGQQFWTSKVKSLR